METAVAEVEAAMAPQASSVVSEPETMTTEPTSPTTVASPESSSEKGTTPTEEETPTASVNEKAIEDTTAPTPETALETPPPPVSGEAPLTETSAMTEEPTVTAAADDTPTLAEQTEADPEPAEEPVEEPAPVVETSPSATDVAAAVVEDGVRSLKEQCMAELRYWSTLLQEQKSGEEPEKDEEEMEDIKPLPSEGDLLFLSPSNKTTDKEKNAEIMQQISTGTSIQVRRSPDDKGKESKRKINPTLSSSTSIATGRSYATGRSSVGRRTVATNFTTPTKKTTASYVTITGLLNWDNESTHQDDNDVPKTLSGEAHSAFKSPTAMAARRLGSWKQRSFDEDDEPEDKVEYWWEHLESDPRGAPTHDEAENGCIVWGCNAPLTKKHSLGANSFTEEPYVGFRSSPTPRGPRFVDIYAAAIQCAWRRHHAESKYNRMRRAAPVIQRSWRFRFGLKKLVTQYRTEHMRKSAGRHSRLAASKKRIELLVQKQREEEEEIREAIREEIEERAEELRNQKEKEAALLRIQKEKEAEEFRKQKEREAEEFRRKTELEIEQFRMEKELEAEEIRKQKAKEAQDDISRVLSTASAEIKDFPITSGILANPEVDPSKGDCAVTSSVLDFFRVAFCDPASTDKSLDASLFDKGIESFKPLLSQSHEEEGDKQKDEKIPDQTKDEPPVDTDQKLDKAIAEDDKPEADTAEGEQKEESMCVVPEQEASTDEDPRYQTLCESSIDVGPGQPEQEEEKHTPSEDKKEVDQGAEKAGDDSEEAGQSEQEEKPAASEDKNEIKVDQVDENTGDDSEQEEKPAASEDENEIKVDQVDENTGDDSEQEEKPAASEDKNEIMVDQVDENTGDDSEQEEKPAASEDKNEIKVDQVDENTGDDSEQEEKQTVVSEDKNETKVDQVDEKTGDDSDEADEGVAQKKEETAVDSVILDGEQVVKEADVTTTNIAGDAATAEPDVAEKEQDNEGAEAGNSAVDAEQDVVPSNSHSFTFFPCCAKMGGQDEVPFDESKSFDMKETLAGNGESLLDQVASAEEAIDENADAIKTEPPVKETEPKEVESSDAAIKPDQPAEETETKEVESPTEESNMEAKNQLDQSEEKKALESEDKIVKPASREEFPFDETKSKDLTSGEKEDIDLSNETNGKPDTVASGVTTAPITKVWRVEDEPTPSTTNNVLPWRVEDKVLPWRVEDEPAPSVVNKVLPWRVEDEPAKSTTKVWRIEETLSPKEAKVESTTEKKDGSLKVQEPLQPENAEKTQVDQSSSGQENKQSEALTLTKEEENEDATGKDSEAVVKDSDDPVTKDEDVVAVDDTKSESVVVPVATTPRTFNFFSCWGTQDVVADAPRSLIDEVASGVVGESEVPAPTQTEQTQSLVKDDGEQHEMSKQTDEPKEPEDKMPDAPVEMDKEESLCEKPFDVPETKPAYEDLSVPVAIKHDDSTEAGQESIEVAISHATQSIDKNDSAGNEKAGKEQEEDEDVCLDRFSSREALQKEIVFEDGGSNMGENMRQNTNSLQSDENEDAERFSSSAALANAIFQQLDYHEQEKQAQPTVATESSTTKAEPATETPQVTSKESTKTGSEQDDQLDGDHDDDVLESGTSSGDGQESNAVTLQESDAFTAIPSDSRSFTMFNCCANKMEDHCDIPIEESKSILCEEKAGSDNNEQEKKHVVIENRPSPVSVETDHVVGGPISPISPIKQQNSTDQKLVELEHRLIRLRKQKCFDELLGFANRGKKVWLKNGKSRSKKSKKIAASKPRAARPTGGRSPPTVVAKTEQKNQDDNKSFEVDTLVTGSINSVLAGETP